LNPNERIQQWDSGGCGVFVLCAGSGWWVMMSERRYQVIYADPPWQYSFSKSDSRKIENQYSTMTVDEICALDIPAADSSVLYMWATAPKLQEAFQVMSAWGFEYKTHAVWDKQNIGMGYWFRGQHELLMVGTRGNFSPPERSEVVSSIFKQPRTLHSKKPDGIRAMICDWFPDAKRLEMFSRPNNLELFGDSNDWDTFGNEMESSVLVSDTEPSERSVMTETK